MRVARGIFWGLFVAWIGVWIWLGATVMPDMFAWQFSWPLIFSMLGLIMLFEGFAKLIKQRRRRYKSGGWEIFWGLVFIALGLVIWFSKTGIIQQTFGQLWPFIFVVLGLAIIISVLVKVLRKPRSVNVVINKLESGEIDVDDAVDEIRRAKNKRYDKDE